MALNHPVNQDTHVRRYRTPQRGLSYYMGSPAHTQLNDKRVFKKCKFSGESSQREICTRGGDEGVIMVRKACWAMRARRAKRSRRAS